MKRRAKERVETSLDARFFYGNELCSGVATNCSEIGMCIYTRRCLPCSSQVNIILRTEERIYTVSVRVKRIHLNMKDGSYDSMGVEVLSPPAEYAFLIHSLRSQRPGFAFTVSDESLMQTTECKNNFKCLTDYRTMCLIENTMNGRGLFIRQEASSGTRCPYKTSSEHALICNCPTRYEIFDRYRV